MKTPTITFHIAGIVPGADVLLESVGGDVLGRYTHRLPDQPRPAAETALNYRDAITAAARQHNAPIIGARHISAIT